ncbi:glycosyltransferase [Limosilactobacillus agrestis]|uniref:Glycosyltransferase n=1 Tax=Limosilactobacillus agrestis TaxID=2759748 RepID=A0ABS8R661_9LACO|nr:glycosyltransferase family 2 protein [Limosilactobacillus agrestis]MCD7129807.1 glycosyltransferase [Limosilactobacillus agrestis]
MKEKLLSVIMPTFNSAKYIDKTIESLISMIGNSTENVEVIFTDDGSSDSTLVKLEKLSKKYSFMKIIYNSHRGVSDARNAGINIASGEYITFLDSDDEFESEFISKFKKIIANNDHPDLIFTDVKGIDRPKFLVKANKSDQLKIMQYSLALGKTPTNKGIASKFFKRSVIVENNLNYDSRIVISEDSLFNLKYISKINSALLIPDNFYYVKEAHTLKYYSEKNLSGQIAYLDELKKLLKDYEDNSLAIEILNREKINATDIIIDRYYGPLYINKTNTLNESIILLRETVEKNNLNIAFKTNEFDDVLSLRYRIFRRLLKYHQYRLCFLFDKYLDEIKGYNRFRQ